MTTIECLIVCASGGKAIYETRKPRLAVDMLRLLQQLNYRNFYIRAIVFTEESGGSFIVRNETDMDYLLRLDDDNNKATTPIL